MLLVYEKCVCTFGILKVSNTLTSQHIHPTNNRCQLKIQKRMENIQISIKSVNVFYMLHRTVSMCGIYSFMQHIKRVTDPQPHPRL